MVDPMDGQPWAAMALQGLESHRAPMQGSDGMKKTNSGDGQRTPALVDDRDGHADCRSMLLRAPTLLAIALFVAGCGDDTSPPAAKPAGDPSAVSTPRPAAPAKVTTLTLLDPDGKEIRIQSSDILAILPEAPQIPMITPAEDTAAVDKLRTAKVRLIIHGFRSQTPVNDDQAPALAACGLTACPTTVVVARTWPKGAIAESQRLMQPIYEAIGGKDPDMKALGLKMREVNDALVKQFGKPTVLTRDETVWLNLADVVGKKQRELVAEHGRYSLNDLDRLDAEQRDEVSTLVYGRGNQDSTVQVHVPGLMALLGKLGRWDTVEIKPVMAGSEYYAMRGEKRPATEEAMKADGTVGGKPMSGTVADITYLLHGRVDFALRRRLHNGTSVYEVACGDNSLTTDAAGWAAITADGGTRLSLSTLNPESRASLIAALRIDRFGVSPDNIVAVYFADRTKTGSSTEATFTKTVFTYQKREVIITAAKEAKLYVEEQDTPVVEAPVAPRVPPTVASQVGDPTRAPVVGASVAPPFSVVGDWTIVEGSGKGGVFHFLAGGTWTSPWSNFGGTWRTLNDKTLLTASDGRPTGITVQPDGKIRLIANVNLLLERSKP